MDYVRGRIFSDSVPKNVNPEELRSIYNSLNDVLQKIHSVDVEKAGLHDYGKPGTQYTNYCNLELPWTTYNILFTLGCNSRENILAFQ